jgi:thiosulfate/3-mercaptopyruvate sulfurtransferase
MVYETLISVEEASRYVADENWIFVDCRFDLIDPDLGLRQYQGGHIPGAVYVHLNNDLSNPATTGNGRHPLPPPEKLTELFGRLGIDETKQVVVYDGANGVYASRLWWMLHYMGHRQTAVLDGGWAAWKRVGPINHAPVQKAPTIFTGQPRPELLAKVEDVQKELDNPLSRMVLVDSRSEDRYLGKGEVLDPVAGHIPDAMNLFYGEQWTDDAYYRSPEEMRNSIGSVVGDTPAKDVVFYCGSGVSACVNLLAMKHAGMGDGRLYVGSWSEWISDPARPFETTTPHKDIRDTIYQTAATVGANRVMLTGHDLNNINLYNLDLSGAKMNKTKMRNAQMVQTKLNGTSLEHADLTRANLQDANLANAKLFMAKMTEANLTNAILTDAYLGKTDLRRANLTNCNMTNARLHYTDLRDTDLSSVKLHGADLRNARYNDATIWPKDQITPELMGAVKDKRR